MQAVGRVLVEAVPGKSLYLVVPSSYSFAALLWCVGGIRELLPEVML